jgi:rare lipoprotein A
VIVKGSFGEQRGVTIFHGTGATIGIDTPTVADDENNRLLWHERGRNQWCPDKPSLELPFGRFVAFFRPFSPTRWSRLRATGAASKGDSGGVSTTPPMHRTLIPIIAIFSTAASASTADAGVVQRGKASWYHEPQRLASGGRFDPNGMTAAHRTLPFGTVVRVTNVRNKRTTVVRINDRGPYSKGRILDLSKAAAKELQMIHSGTAMVTVEVVSPAG